MSVSCDTTTVQAIWIGINIPVAIILLLIATFCRCRFNPFKCCGLPKLVYSMNFIDLYSNRLPYVFAFMVTSNVILNLLQLDLASPEVQQYLVQYSSTVRFFLWALIKYMCIVIAGLVFYPLLVCITYSNFMTDVIGLLFTCNWFSMYIFIYTVCPVGSVVGLINGLSYAPAVVSCSGLSAFFIWRFIKRFRNTSVSQSISPSMSGDDFKHSHYYERVKFLLLPAITWKRHMEPKGKLNQLIRLIKPTFPGFRYSTRIVCTVGLSLIVLYQMSILYIANVLVIVQQIFQTLILVSSPLQDIIELSFNLSSYPAMCISFFNCLLFLRNYRENTRELWKGDRYKFSNKPTPPHSLLISCLSFSSLSIAYTFWGFLVLQIILWIIMFVIVIIIRFNLIVALIQQYWMYLFGIVLFIVIQQILARFVFLRRNTNGALVINNRHLFHIIIHFFFFLNIIVGLVGSLLRIIKVAVISILVIGRVDLCLAPRDFEWADKGFGAYRSFLELEVSLTHPVVVTFCHILNQSRSRAVVEPDNDVERQNTVAGFEGDVAIKDISASQSTKDRVYSSRRVRNRWLKALTMIRNKRLVYERLHELSEIGDDDLIFTNPQHLTEAKA
nr:stimulated by retinoic acid gene 6 protein-like [Lytechinus pictus]